MKIGVKYCGGCNPQYDRVEVVEALQKRLEGKAAFVSRDDDGIDLILAVEGCETACVDLSSFEGKRIFEITSAEDADKFVALIYELTRG